MFSIITFFAKFASYKELHIRDISGSLWLYSAIVLFFVIQKDFIRKCDCSIASSIVEHVSKPYNLIKKILNKSNKIFILRTYLGEKDEFIIKNNAKNPYYFHQFSKKKIFLMHLTINFYCNLLSISIMA